MLIVILLICSRCVRTGAFYALSGLEKSAYRHHFLCSWPLEGQRLSRTTAQRAPVVSLRDVNVPVDMSSDSSSVSTSYLFASEIRLPPAPPHNGDGSASGSRWPLDLLNVVQSKVQHSRTLQFAQPPPSDALPQGTDLYTTPRHRPARKEASNKAACSRGNSVCFTTLVLSIPALPATVGEAEVQTL